ncbi:vWA domain-containing protein [Chitinophaga nivalis]|uniref:VWA domain-containing protein n=1 Tax=Chitinophaga nivalis TaxID=2991709 RepID=A0ABT3IE82_9BACT|nr:vWA domain-containing protein [Chitinophaga nivalis]MCW3468037.1 VWA domain-containing protein [Chitinophaga nivalis]MCW3482272.1 VWA domain-containing protein [Chitinophaga nivalis]
MKKLLFVMLAALVLTGSHSFAQSLSFPISPTHPFTTLEYFFTHEDSIRAGTADIGIVPGGYTGIRWTLSPDGTYTGFNDPVTGELSKCIIKGITVELPPNATTTSGAAETAKLRIYGIPETVVDDIIVSFTVFAINVANGDIFGSAKVEMIIHSPLDLAVVLDRSGSMGSNLDGTAYVAPPGQSRWDYLKSAVAMMADHLNGLSKKKYELISLNMFADYSGSIPAAAPYNTLSLIDMNASNLSSLSSQNGALSAIVPAGSTPLGNGILQGRDILLAPAVKLNRHKKAMLVFSDGEQNMPYEVLQTGTDAWKKTTNGQWLRGAPTDPQIKIYTINLGVSGSAPNTMQSIARANGGTPVNITVEPGSGKLDSVFLTSFTRQLPNIFKGSSPQVIVLRNATFPNGQPPARVDSFIVNKGASSVIGTMMVAGAFKPRFISIKKDGRELLPFVKQRFDSSYLNFSISFPNNFLQGVTGDGRWEIRTQLDINPGVVQPCTFMVVVDDHALKSGFTVAGAGLKVGQSIKPSATFTYKGNAITNANVNFVLFKPGTDVNDLIARRSAPYYDTLPSDPVSPGISKLKYLMRDTSFVNAIRSQSTVYPLPYDTVTKSYTATISGLNVSGVHQGVFLVNGTANTDNTDNTYGTLQRYHSESFYVRFPGIAVAASRPVYQYNPAGGFNRALIFRPVATNGKYIGPGWGKSITLESTGIGATYVQDTGDGYYKLGISGAFSGNIILSIAGEQIYAGPLSALQTVPGPKTDGKSRTKK